MNYMGKDITVSNEIAFITASESAYNQIKEKILNGELKAGERLSMRKMAHLAGSSVSPVIEALNKLKEDGLIESQPKWGCRVAIYDKEKIEDIYMLRMAIECQIIRILTLRMTSEQYLRCKEITDKLDSYKYNETDVDEISVLHQKFHLMLAEMTNFSSMIKTLVRCQLNWMLLTSDRKRSHTWEHLPHWHGRLLDAIMERDPDKSEALMRKHINEGLSGILEVTTNYN